MMEDENIIIRRGLVEDAEILSAFMNWLADEPLDTVSRQRYTAEEERDFLQKAADKERAFFLLALHGPPSCGARATSCRRVQLGSESISFRSLPPMSRAIRGVLDHPT
jgi:hypothetical protein